MADLSGVIKAALFVLLLFSFVMIVKKTIDFFDKRKNLENYSKEEEIYPTIQKTVKKQENALTKTPKPSEILVNDGRVYILISYLDAFDAITERVIVPIFYEGALIKAVCYLRDDIRTFRADRIITALDLRENATLTANELMVLCALYADYPPNGNRRSQRHPINAITSYSDDCDMVAGLILDLCVHFARLDGRLLQAEMSCIYNGLIENWRNLNIPEKTLYPDDLKSRKTKNIDIEKHTELLINISSVNLHNILMLICIIYISSHNPNASMFDYIKYLSGRFGETLPENLLIRLSKKIVSTNP